MAIWAKFFSMSALISLVRIMGAGIGFLTQIMLARLLDPAEIGLFYFLSSVATIAGLIAAHGYPSIMTRFVSRYRERGRQNYLAAFLHRAQRDTLIWSVTAVFGLTLAGLVWPGVSTGTRIAFVLSVLAIVPMALHRVYGSMATAYRQFLASYVPGFFLRPTVFALALGVMLLVGARPTVAELTAFSLAAFVLAFGVQYATVSQKLRDIASVGKKVDARLYRRWHREALPLVMVASFTGLLSDLAVFVVTPFMSLTDVAEFGICLKIGFLIGFTVQVSHQIILPDLGDAVARREKTGMSAKIASASLFPIALTIAGVAGSIAFGDHFLALFNEEFRAAQNTLTIIMVAQFVRAVSGPSSILLSLKGQQTVNAWICAASLVVLLSSSAALASLWGAEGAAWAVVVTTVFWQAMTAVALYRFDGARADLVGVLVRDETIEPAE